MCKLFVINSLYLGNRSLGYELYDGKGVVEMTEKQVRDGILAGQEIYGLKVSENGIDLEPDREGFFMNNLVAHRHMIYRTQISINVLLLNGLFCILLNFYQNSEFERMRILFFPEKILIYRVK